MFNEVSLAQLVKDKQAACEQRAARARLLKRVRAGKPALQCIVCEKVAGLLILFGEKLKALVQNKPQTDDIAIVDMEQLNRLFNSQTPDGLFI